jgi:AraC family transcriptional regulator
MQSYLSSVSHNISDLDNTTNSIAVSKNCGRSILMIGSAVCFDRRPFAGYQAQHRRFVDLAVTETLYRPGQYIPSHSHERSYISVVLRGSYTEDCGASVCNVLPGHLIMHVPGESHSNHFHKAGGQLLNLELSPEFWNRIAEFDNRRTFSRRVLRSSYALHLGLRLQKELASSDVASGWAMEGLMMELVAETIRDRAPRIGIDRGNWLSSVTELLRARYREPLTLKEIASVVSVHPVHLARSFRKHHGCSIGDFIRRLRVEAACRNLLDSDASIAEVALHAGFSDQSHFCRILKQQTGMSPKQFREHLGRGGNLPDNLRV